MAEPSSTDIASHDDLDGVDDSRNAVSARFRRASRRRSSAMHYDGKLQNILRIQEDSERCMPAFRVISTGSNGKAELADGIYFSLPGYSVNLWAAYNDMHVAGNAYHLCLIDRASGKIESAFAYDVDGAGEQTQGRRLRHLVYDLNEVDDSKIVVVFTTGYPGSKCRLEAGLPEALFRCGASDAFVDAEFEMNSIMVVIAEQTLM